MAALEASQKRGGSCGVRERAVASLPSSTSQKSPPRPRKIVQCIVKLATVGFVNGLKPPIKCLFVNEVCLCVCVHVCVCVCVCVCVGQCDRCWTAIVMSFNAYWVALLGPNCNVREILTG